MLLPGVLLGFIISISGVNGEKKSICALKKSSVDLPCSSPSSSMKWFTVEEHGGEYVQKEISADGTHVTYKMSEENHLILTINDLRRNDSKHYCCSRNDEKPAVCWDNAVQLTLSDLQVKVIPSTEGQTVTLMCSTSCPLTGNPAAYIWYKNGEFLYEDWSPWYQEMLSSDEAVRYSCAVKGKEDLRAPKVSVDSVTATCFSVTYSRGRMCSKNQTSHKESCSITFPRELKVETSSGSTVAVKCSTSCPEVDPKLSYRWYEDRTSQRRSEKPQFSVPSSSTTSFSCAVKDHEDLQSADVCAVENMCRTLNYASRRICALLGSSVDIISQYNKQVPFKSWYKMKLGEQEDASELIEDKTRVQYRDNMNEHILQINNLKREDSGEYVFATQRTSGRTGKLVAFPRVTLVVTGLSVWIHPAEVTEGQKVTLTCSTSCPLSGNYTWKFNSKPLNQNQNKHLVLDPVSVQDAGNYSCAVRIGRRIIISSEKTLSVQRAAGTFAAAAGVAAAFLIITLLVVVFWIRKKRTSAQSVTAEAADNTEQLNPGLVSENVSAQPPDQEDLHYSSVQFSKNPPDPLYATVQPHQPKEDEHVAYSVVNIRPKVTPE